MPVYTIEMRWRCPHCRQMQRGLARHCTGCGRAKGADCIDEMPDDLSEAAAIPDPHVGPDWCCRYDDARMASSESFCHHCGAPQVDAKVWKTIETLVEFVGDKPLALQRDVVVPKPVPAPSPLLREDPCPCDVDAPLPEQAHTYRTAPKKPSKPAKEPERDFGPIPYQTSIDVEPPFTRRPLGGAGKVALVSVALLGLFLAGWLLFRTRIVDAVVTDVYWHSAVEVERHAKYQHEGWTPSNGAVDVVDLGERRHHVDHVLVGTHREEYQEPYDCRCRPIKGACTKPPPSCKSQNNGTARCTKSDSVCAPDTTKCDTCLATKYRTVKDYQDVPRYQHYFQWQQWEWRYNRTAEVQAHNTDPKEPTVTLYDQERIGARTHTYRVTFRDTSGETYRKEPSSVDAFQRFHMGDHVHLRVSVLGQPEVVP